MGLHPKIIEHRLESLSPLAYEKLSDAIEILILDGNAKGRPDCEDCELEDGRRTTVCEGCIRTFAQKLFTWMLG